MNPKWYLDLNRVLNSIKKNSFHRGLCCFLVHIFLRMLKWYSEAWISTVTSRLIILYTNFMTLIPKLTFAKFWDISKEHLRRVWHAGSKPYSSGSFGAFIYALIVETRFSQICRDFRDFSPRIPLVFLDLLLTDISEHLDIVRGHFR